VTEAVEGAEDDAGAGERDLLALGPTGSDVVLALAASGSTPYAVAAVEAARARGALTVGFANNPGSPLLEAAEHAVLLDTGPEVVTGSTRLKAGTAQKIALNTFSTAVMVGLGKVYGNLMVDLKATNAKLRGRALRLAVAATGAAEAEAGQALEAAGWSVKTAIVMLRLGLGARRRGHGSRRRAAGRGRRWGSEPGRARPDRSSVLGGVGDPVGSMFAPRRRSTSR
jgi:N-acetylmuramic acid 6-phosphate etherase